MSQQMTSSPHGRNALVQPTAKGGELRQPEKVSAKLAYPALTRMPTAPAGSFGEVPVRA